MLDVNHFKLYKDALGHAAGDVALRSVAEVLQAPIRAGVEALKLPNPNSPTSQWLTSSIGVSTIVPNQLDDLSKFFVGANRAMYAAKDAGRKAVMAVNPGSSTWEALKAVVTL